MRSVEWAMVTSGRVEPDILEDWNQWYDEVHLPEILECPGFVRGTRYVEEGADGNHFVTVYELNSREALESEEFKKRRGLGPFGERVTVETRLHRCHLTMNSDSAEGVS